MQGLPQGQNQGQRQGQNQAQSQYSTQGLYPPQSQYHAQSLMQHHSQMQPHGQMQRQGQFMPQGWLQGYYHLQHRSHVQEFQNYLTSRPSWQAEGSHQDQHSHIHQGNAPPLPGYNQNYGQYYGPNLSQNSWAPAQSGVQDPRYFPRVPHPGLRQANYQPQGNRREYINLSTPPRARRVQGEGGQEPEQEGSHSQASSETYVNVPTPPQVERVREGEQGPAQGQHDGNGHDGDLIASFTVWQEAEYRRAYETANGNPRGQASNLPLPARSPAQGGPAQAPGSPAAGAPPSPRGQAGGLWVHPPVMRQLQSQAHSRQGQPECWYHANGWTRPADADYEADRCQRVAPCQGGVCQPCYHFYRSGPNGIRDAELAMEVTENGGWRDEPYERNTGWGILGDYTPNPEAAPFVPTDDEVVDPNRVTEIDDGDLYSA